MALVYSHQLGRKRTFSFWLEKQQLCSIPIPLSHHRMTVKQEPAAMNRRSFDHFYSCAFHAVTCQDVLKDVEKKLVKSNSRLSEIASERGWTHTRAQILYCHTKSSVSALLSMKWQQRVSVTDASIRIYKYININQTAVMAGRRRDAEGTHYPWTSRSYNQN